MWPALTSIVHIIIYHDIYCDITIRAQTCVLHGWLFTIDSTHDEPYYYYYDYYYIPSHTDAWRCNFMLFAQRRRVCYISATPRPPSSPTRVLWRITDYFPNAHHGHTLVVYCCFLPQRLFTRLIYFFGTRKSAICRHTKAMCLLTSRYYFNVILRWVFTCSNTPSPHPCDETDCVFLFSSTITRTCCSHDGKSHSCRRKKSFRTFEQ